MKVVFEEFPLAFQHAFRY